MLWFIIRRLFTHSKIRQKLFVTLSRETLVKEKKTLESILLRAHSFYFYLFIFFFFFWQRFLSISISFTANKIKNFIKANWQHGWRLFPTKKKTPFSNIYAIENFLRNLVLKPGASTILVLDMPRKKYMFPKKHK